MEAPAGLAAGFGPASVFPAFAAGLVADGFGAGGAGRAAGFAGLFAAGLAAAGFAGAGAGFFEAMVQGVKG
ncbi:MAG: hypothetical protein FJ397_03635 [Verrucomicrobia bacterium]|nr:hypothetical protein [Verrucomicrobiota bacterium]